MYCGEPGHGPVELFADWVSGSRSRGSARNSGRDVIFTQSGRAAIRLAAEVWNIGNSDEILVPAYNCGSEISPFLGLGAKIKMYRVDKSAKIDIGDLLNRLTSNTRVVVVTHYSGRPSEWAAGRHLQRTSNNVARGLRAIPFQQRHRPSW